MGKRISQGVPHSSHWGAFSVQSHGDELEVTPHPCDPMPSPILPNLNDAASPDCRIGQPMIRRGWLDNGPGPDTSRGKDAFVPVSWERAYDHLANELQRIVDRYSNEAVFGGSYGWSSAGRFHHAQSQIHRFLNTTLGGYCRSVGNYSAGAAQVIAPHVFGTLEETNRKSPIWGPMLSNTELVVSFGGMALKNSSVSGGGNSNHNVAGVFDRLQDRGVRFVLFSPLRADLPEWIRAEWHAIRPATDTAVMLALAHVLIVEDLLDRAFLAKHCVGFDRFEAYIRGQSDGIAKTPGWAELIAQLPAADIIDLARDMAARRTLITVSQSVQRAEHGEQPVWAAITLAAMLGQIGLPGGGFSYGLGSIGNVGKPPVAVPLPTLSQGKNGARGFIPVARISDMLLHPGKPFSFNGQKLVYPDVKLVYWAGGNPFHHQQDLTRLAEAFSRPDTIVVHEPYWTSSARHADIVLPATITMERDDIGAAGNDPKMITMRKAIEPFQQTKDEYEIFSELAQRLDRHQEFTEGRTAREWMAFIYETTRVALAERDLPAPDFDEFWAAGELEVPTTDRLSILEKFRQDPQGAPLPTPSGKIEIFSEVIAGFGYDDCAGHPAWFEPEEWLGGEIVERFPIQLVANQPAFRLHSQLDFGRASLGSKIAGREPLTIHPDTAKARGIVQGSIVRVFNDRGSFLAGANISDAIRRDVIQIATGAWYDPQDIVPFGTVCVHGNPNTVTRDRGTSSLAQGSTGQLSMVDVELFHGPLPELRCHKPPRLDA
ncbi:molybdopterin-dependent oxidoreductase [Tianweitania sp. Rool2]|uniref:Molybdopterin-dependent oxidoreductase n=2 Tax=Oryzicola mucosus TaxID=2767425 RepID=A0A8J6PMJ9_9HYPH|nr:molybdopterin-dependent oxidoreductase [Oryzicola mucosus]MBD0417394.1 molybdopterin-dependent oxidoreductase [Oryzicola mucosus]